MKRLRNNESISSLIERLWFYASVDGALEESSAFEDFFNSREGLDIDYYNDDDLAKLNSIIEPVQPNLAGASKPYTQFYLLDSASRISFCPACAEEDLKSARTIIWRIHWSYGWYVVCLEHSCMLMTISKGNYISRVGQRTESALRMLACRPHAKYSVSLLPPDSITTSTIPHNFMRAECEILDIALRVQKRIMYLIEAGNYGCSELAMISDLLALTLRGHVRGKEIIPYSYRLAKQLTGIGYSNYIDMGSKHATVMTGEYAVCASYPRMIGLALTAAIIRHSGVDFRWYRVCDLLAERGILVPRTSKLLYLAVVGGADTAEHRWYLKRVKSYPIELRKICKEYYTI
ncbi:TniQ family protein [Pseudomonas marincola]|uniref:TniQ family protein n=1 Tax=Pseudomonas marincola TaxID=437900 RepID=UPI0008E20EBE|nr:TniQ family protein [Pseudomonas marincola]SFU20551.1 TniQ protein [Pseudomonas marincola]